MNFKHYFHASILIIIITLISFSAYRDILSFFFTGMDTFSLIDVSRIHSFGDVIRLVKEPMMNGTTFVNEVKYYRPISSFSFSLDYAIWKLNPFGYFFMNLSLHLFVSILVFFVAYSLTKGKLFIAFISAVIFTTHPILVNSVPAISRRQDIIAGLFILSSLLMFWVSLSKTSYKQIYLSFSLLFYIVALLAKELAIIFPVLVFVYLLIFSEEKNFKYKFTRALKRSFPYFVVTFVCFVWRLYVLGDLGGEQKTIFGLHNLIKLFQILMDYFIDLVYPTNFLLFLFEPISRMSTFKISLIGLTTFFIIITFIRRFIYEKILNSSRRIINVVNLLLIIGIAFSIMGVIGYPIIFPLVDRLKEITFQSRGIEMFSQLSENQEALIVGDYYNKANLFYLKSCFFGIFSQGAILIGINRGINKRNLIMSSDTGNLLFFLLIWLLLPLILNMVTMNYSHRGMYVSVIPFSIILSVTLSKLINNIRLSFQEKSSRLVFLKYAPSLSTLGLLIISLLIYSPIFTSYREWKESSNLSAMFLEKLTKSVSELPKDVKKICFYNFPGEIYSKKTTIPRVNEVGYCLVDYSLKSWLDMNYPNNNMEIVIKKYLWLRKMPQSISFELLQKNEKAMITIQYY